MKNGNVHVMPGDTMYPKEVNLVEKQLVDRSDITINELHKISPVKNRITFIDGQVNVIFTDNANGEDSHVIFSLPRYSKTMYENQEIKNKL